ncbi:hypothetical protein MN116_004793 [Schistosoma mekongi]|uniref:Uncharacterized protein n=1 Tax=Schistosoma mekongi TaxID=38744 RepID=A0AAE1ZDC7_SCHME|nr:hypothetical protein MN116_004793 [Schistosoma mekongi]
MTDLIYDRMVETFPNYGQNMQVTNAWDIIQNNLRCCAIHNRGWADYNKTVWYRLTNDDIHQHDKLIPHSALQLTCSKSEQELSGITVCFPINLNNHKGLRPNY